MNEKLYFKEVKAIDIELELKKGNADEAIKIMKYVASFYRKKGHNVWDEKWLEKSKLFSEDVNEDNFYTGYINGKEALAFIIQYSDREFWDEDRNAVYLHKLCIKPEFSGMNISDMLMEKLKFNLKNRGINKIRLDCAVDKVKEIYARSGFRKVGETEYRTGLRADLMELNF